MRKSHIQQVIIERGRVEIEFVNCDFCEHDFIRGSGHMCWCSDCSKKHPMCNNCYVENLKDGKIRDTPLNRNHISEKNKKKMI